MYFFALWHIILWNVLRCPSGPGSFILRRIIYMEKCFKTYDEMIDILKSRGVNLSTPELKGTAKKSLQHEGYYNLINGYKMLFLERDAENRFIIPDKYKPNTTVDEIYYLCHFDKKLRAILLRSILHIETNMKNLISYTFSENHGHKNYLIYDNFDTQQKNAEINITNLFSDIQRQIASRVSDPSIGHYLKKHGYIPLWVLNNILTLGIISKFYSLMKQKERQDIAKIFNLQDNELTSILTYLSSIRNICAHSNRLYCFRTKRPLVDMNIHHQLAIPRTKGGELEYGKRDLFAIMIILKILLSKNEFLAVIEQINRALMSLKGKLVVLSEQDVLDCMGFPPDWSKKLQSL